MVASAGSKSPRLDKKHTVIILQWLIVIVTSYLMLFSEGQVSEDPMVYGLVVVLLISALVIYRLPVELFDHRYFDTALLLTDTMLISAAIYMNRTIPWDLFLIYFFILLLAAIGTNLLRIVIGSVVVSLLYLAVLVEKGAGIPQISTDLVIRIPFLFGVSVLYGYLSENANREKKRAELAEERERTKMDLVSSLAHDIKNPLGIVMGYAEMLIEFLEERKGEKEHLELLERIQTSGQRIVNLVTGFLDASKAEVGKLDHHRSTRRMAVIDQPLHPRYDLVLPDEEVREHRRAVAADGCGPRGHHHRDPGPRPLQMIEPVAVLRHPVVAIGRFMAGGHDPVAKRQVLQSEGLEKRIIRHVAGPCAWDWNRNLAGGSQDLTHVSSFVLAACVRGNRMVSSVA